MGHLKDGEEILKVQEGNDKDDDIEILKEITRSQLEEDVDFVEEISPDTDVEVICLDGAPNPIPPYPPGHREEMKRLQTNNPPPSKKIRLRPESTTQSTDLQELSINGVDTENYARAYCDWYERRMHPFLQTRVAPFLRHYEHWKKNSRDGDQVSSDEQEIETSDGSTQTEKIFLEGNENEECNFGVQFEQDTVHNEKGQEPGYGNAEEQDSFTTNYDVEKNENRDCSIVKSLENTSAVEWMNLMASFGEIENFEMKY